MAKTILIADDEPNQVVTLETFLSQRGYHVIAVGDGEQVFPKALEWTPQLIILDIMMPKMDGTEVAMVLKRDMRTKHIPIFFVTALISPEDQLSTGPIFAKPVKLSELLEAIQKATADEVVS